MRDDVFEFEDIDLIAGGISLQRGKLPEHVITLADEWLLRASKVERRALRARRRNNRPTDRPTSA